MADESTMQTRNEFIARKLKTTDKIAQAIGADALVYMTIPEMVKAVKGPTKRIREFCMACMDGNYPTGDVTSDVLRTIESERAREARKTEEKPVAARSSRAPVEGGAGEGTEPAVDAPAIPRRAR